MMPLTRPEIAAAMGATIHTGASGAAFTAVSTDTRKLTAGALFFALAGANHDAHDHLGAALSAGAGGLVISRASALPADLAPSVFVALVADTQAALTALARAVRARTRVPVVCVTGSVGKTTMKDMIAAALSARGTVGRTPGNWNNEIGAPLSILALRGDEDYVVFELGMSAPGEIDRLTQLTQPEIGVITAAAAAHLEFFADVDAIADAKAELWEAMPAGARAITCADDARLVARARRLRPDGLLTYGLATDADFRVTEVSQTQTGTTASITHKGETVSVSLRVLGAHNAVNAAGALAVAATLGLDLAAAASALSERFAPAPHRMAIRRAATGLTVLDDCYNANPASTMAALAALGDVAKSAARRGAVIGSMLELGETSDALHRAVGEAAAHARVDWLAATGPYAESLLAGARAAGLTDLIAAADAPDLIDAVRAFAAPDRWLLLKGSRGQRLERLLAPLGVAGEEAHA
ncbi:MAG: UDP-N-acetylmuramoyl-tripeptide--D-alanyl-D-alanine ligase [Myxococcota bacterium]